VTSSHKVEDKSEHLAVAVNEVMLLEGVENNGNGPVEHLADARLAELGECGQRGRVDATADVDVNGRIVDGEARRPWRAQLGVVTGLASLPRAAGGRLHEILDSGGR